MNNPMPDRIRALGIWWRVIDDPTLEQRTKAENSEAAWGEADSKKLTISVEASIVEDQKREAIDHELAEISNSELDPTLRLTHPQLQTFRRQIFAILRDNPLLVCWLFPEVYEVVVGYLHGNPALVRQLFPEAFEGAP